MADLLERLGRPAGSRLLIVSCVGLGVSHAANQGVLTALRLGVGTSASLAMPCPWAHSAANQLQHDDVGIELTLNAEYPSYRWAPITQAPSLLDGEGGFPRTVEDLWDHADVEEVHRECRAQIVRAMHWGIEVTHLGSHLDALALRPEFFDVYLELAQEFTLPIRLPSPLAESRAGFPLRSLADEANVLHADVLIVVRSAEALRDALEEAAPGVTEVVLRPAKDSAELRAYAPDWPTRCGDATIAAGDAALRDVIQSFEHIGYRTLRDAQRSLPST